MALTQVDGGLLSPTNGQYTGFKSRIINGAMMIDQRNAGASINPTNGQYSVDRWKAINNGVTGKFTLQQMASGAATIATTGCVNYLLATSSSAYSVSATDRFAVVQAIEGLNVSDLCWGTSGAKPVTLSFWVQSTLTGTFGGSIQNSAQDRSYPFSYTISSPSTWTQVSITIPGDTTGTWLTTNGTGLSVVFSLGSGSTYSGTSGSWAAADYRSATGATSVVGTNGALWFITGVQLEKGSTATSFDYRPYGTELALCQRYCQSFTASSSSVFAVGSTGFYGDTATIAQAPLPWLDSSILRDVSSASLTMVGTQGTDWAVTTSGAVNQTGFTLTLSSKGNVITCTKTSHGLTPSNTFTRILTSSGKAIVTSEL